MPSLSPVALFIYKRPEHTYKTLQALSRNSLAKDTPIVVLADACKENCSAEESTSVEETRKTAYSFSYSFKSLEMIISPQNKGLANAIRRGVSSVESEYGKVIVLEDL